MAFAEASAGSTKMHARSSPGSGEVPTGLTAGWLGLPCEGGE